MTPTTLGADVVAFSAQIICVIAIAEVLALLVRINAPAVRYQYWRALLLFCLVLPWLQRRQVGVAPVTAMATMGFPSTTVALASPAGATTTASNVPWIEVVLWIVLAGIVFRLARIGYGVIRLRELRRSGRVALATAEHDEFQRTLGTSAEIRYVAGGQPVTYGAWRAVVLLPESLTLQPTEIQRAVLTHELLHVKRRDWVWVIGEEVLRAVFWFHPGTWWLVARVRLAREEAVDELTVRATNQRRAYLEALLAFADATALAPSAPFGRRRHLFRRMKLISKEVVMSSRRILISCALLAVGVIVGSRYAVQAFPLTQTPGAVTVGQPAAPAAAEPGPLERSAKAITPENPIPRRTYSVTPKNPGGAGAVPSAVTLRVTINTLGRVAEARPFGAIAAPPGRPSEAFVKAAIDAVRQWVYEPPADGPIAFDVTFVFTPGSETRLIRHGAPVGAGVEGGVAGGAAGGVVGGVPPPPPPPPPPGWVRDGVTIGTPVRVGGNIRPPTKVKDVRPVFPPEARDADVQGVVILETVIGPEGRVDQVRVLRSIPVFDQAAMDAVEQWEFTPTMLNGTPAPVIMTVTVNFSLN
jgi:TonB family protein